MNENLNLVELLKDCPKGTKLYSPALGECTLEEFFKDKTFPIQVKYKTKDNTFSELFTKEGYLFSEISDAECMLFPSKNQRDWSKWQRPFVKGDVLVSEVGNIVLFSHIDENQVVHYLCLLRPHGTLKISNDVGVGYSYKCTLANDFQKQKLFDALKANGYKWNPETKTLEKLKKEKFDPKTLQPFDKVLVRDIGCETRWHIQFFETMYECTKKYPFMCLGGKIYSFCIPYNDNTKHLIGKSEDAPEFYRYWEE